MDLAYAVTTEQIGHCWYAKTSNAFTFSGAGNVILPQVGVSLTHGGNTGVVDQTFHDSTDVHEEWHVKHSNMAATNSYTALESWSSTYYSNGFKTEAEALDAGNRDFSRALSLATNTFSIFYNGTLSHKDAYTGHHFDTSVNTWRSLNANWGGSYYDKISAWQINFLKTPGNCE